MKPVICLSLSLFVLVAGAPITAGRCWADDVVEERIKEQIQYLIDNPPKKVSFDYALACLYMNQQVDRANELINDYCQENPIEPAAVWAPYPRQLFRLYLMPQCHKHLEDVTRRNIEKMAWNWIYARSQIDPSASSWNNASRGVWHITGSENHDADCKVCNLLAAQILRQAEAPYGPEAKLADGRTVQEHYQAWVSYWKEYFRQRAREGLTCEIAHPSSYGAATIGCWCDAAELAGSASLKRIGQDCLTLFWARVACECEPRTGIRAAWACSRTYKWSYHQTGSVYWAKPVLYAYGWHDNEEKPRGHLGHLLSFYASSYRVPEIVRAIAQDTGRGPYLATARHFGRGYMWMPQPQEIWGVYEVIFDKGHNSSLLRTVYYTPDYTLAALTFDSAKSYIELARQSRTMGVTFSSDIDDRIIVMGSGHGDEKYVVTSCATNGVCGAGCVIVARDPGAVAIDSQEGRDFVKFKMTPTPNNFASEGTRIFVSDGTVWDNRTEDDNGWFFTYSGNAYCGFKIAHRRYGVRPSPHKTGYILALEDMWAPVVIQMGRADDFKDGFDEFKKAVKALPYNYEDGKLSYTSLAGDNYEYWSNSTNLPKINGTKVNLNPTNTYDYPYLKMKHGSGVATVSYPGYKDLVLKFEE